MAKRGMKVKLLKFEKLLYSIVAISLLFFVSFYVCSKATLTKLNIEVIELKSEIKTCENRIESLQMKVNELGSIENISLIAESQGLTYSNENIKVVD